MAKHNDYGETLAVIYVRVSSAMQASKGQGAQSQAARCAEYARVPGYSVIRTFEDKAVSGSLIDRPSMKELLAFLMEYRGLGARATIDDISRLARGLHVHLALREAVAKAGGILESPSITFGDGADEQLVEHMLASAAAQMRTKNTEQVKARMQGRLLQGYWPCQAPKGYRYKKTSNMGKILVPDEPVASNIAEGLNGFASGLLES